MRVRVISLNNCDATPPAIELLYDVAREMRADLDFEHVVVTTAEEAQTYRHIGSPTIQVDGLDIEPEARSVQHYGLT